MRGADDGLIAGSIGGYPCLEPIRVEDTPKIEEEI
jgi:hypothetical protein